MTCSGHQVPTTFSFGGSGSGSGSNSGSSHASQQRKSRGRSPQVTNKGQLKEAFDQPPKTAAKKSRKRKLSGVQPSEMFLLQSPYRNCPPTSFEFLVRVARVFDRFQLIISRNER